MTSLIRIGNSQGVRIPKAIIEQAKLENKELAFRVVEGGLLIKPTKKTRQGWKQEFDKVLKHKEGDQIDNEWLEAPLVEEEDWEFSSP